MPLETWDATRLAEQRLGAAVIAWALPAPESHRHGPPRTQRGETTAGGPTRTPHWDDAVHRVEKMQLSVPMEVCDEHSALLRICRSTNRRRLLASHPGHQSKLRCRPPCGAHSTN
jgi:hypothetical protein